MYKIDITASSRVGCIRENNEDMILVADTFIRNSKTSAHIDTTSCHRAILALADGMGGHNSGEVASSDVLHNLQFFFGDMPAGLSTCQFDETIVEWLGSINHIIEAKGIDAPQYKGMGTTLVALAYYEEKFYWMNCGDSRIYRLRGGHLQQLSTDHSLSNLMGLKEHSNIITNCIGGGCQNSYIDINEFTADIQPGDVLMLCSDGLSDMIGDDVIERMLVQEADADALCQAAEDAGGRDNVSVAIATITL